MSAGPGENPRLIHAVSTAADVHLEGVRFARFRLHQVNGLGPTRLAALVSHFGSEPAVLAASRADLERVKGIGPTLAAAIIEESDEVSAKDQYERMRRLGIRWIHEDDPEYPTRLREIPSRPASVTMRGGLIEQDQLAVGIVGSRRASVYGLAMAEKLAHQLASRGVTIVSGLARGIDAAAHRGALKAGGRTIGVLASGLANIYPPEHAELAEEVVRSGAIISEAPLDGMPIGKLFPQRNRIISGLSIGIVVVEAAARSGALSTARHAVDQNREVFAVPGRAGDVNAEGPNLLLKQGAAMVTSVEDILAGLGPIATSAPRNESTEGDGETDGAAIGGTTVGLKPTGLDPIQMRVWEALSAQPVEMESILETTELRASEASSALLLMEMRRLVKRLPGNRFARNEV